MATRDFLNIVPAINQGIEAGRTLAKEVNDQLALLDSGDRRKFESGAVRDMSAGKGRYDLIPPLWLERMARLMEAGALKYGENNWQKGQPTSCHIDSAMRHLNKFRDGWTDEDHLTMASWNLMAALWTLEEVKAGRLPRSLINVPAVAKANLKEPQQRNPMEVVLGARCSDVNCKVCYPQTV